MGEQRGSGEGGMERVIARVSGSRNGQRRVTIPREAIGVRAGDWVEVRKVEFQSVGVAQPLGDGEPQSRPSPELEIQSESKVKGGEQR